ncbi:MAG TPA: hypothetical protein DHV28_13815 [Ignavibacteriales bacterium]|nr:hypothetical protein [Ignavibacteriales bacterium]
MKLFNIFSIFILLSQILVAQDEWKIFDSTNSPLQSNLIRVVETDSHGNIWLGTNNGLYKYDGVFWKNYTTLNSQLPYNQIDNFYMDRNDNIWFMVNASPYPFFVKFDGETWETVDSNQTCFPDHSRLTRNFVVDGYGTKWINTFSNMIRYDGYSCIYYDLQSVGILTTDCNKIDVDVNDNFFFISQNYSHYTAGIARTSINGWLYNTLSSYGYALDFCIDEPNNLAWVSTFNTSTTKGNLIKLGYDNLQVLNSYNVYNPTNQGLKISGSLVSDLNKNVWQSYTEAMGGNIQLGLLCFVTDGEDWVFYDTTNSALPSNNINSIVVDLNNDKLIATDKGLAVFNELGINFPAQLTENDKIDLGESIIDSLSIKEIKLYNTTSSNLVIDSISFSNEHFFSENSLPLSIITNDSSDIQIEFQSSTVGTFISKLTLHTNQGMFIVVLKATAVNPVNVDDKDFMQLEFFLSQNYPNPFNPSTEINYHLPVAGNVTLKVYDVLGNEVTTLVNEYQQAGSHNEQFTISNVQLSSGIYFYQIKTGEYFATRKMLLLK